MNYRLYLLDEGARIRAAEHFSAQTDEEAIRVAIATHSGCDDVFSAYEVWRGPTRVAGGGRHNSLELEEVVHMRQANIRDLEVRLKMGFECVSASRKLLDYIDKCLERGF